MDTALLEKYGITLADVAQPTTLVKLSKVYNDLNTSLTKEKEAAKSEDLDTGNPAKTAYVEQISNDQDVQDAVKVAEMKIREAISTLLETNPATSIVLHKVIDQISKDMTGEKNYHLAMVLKDQDSPATSTVELPEDWDVRREEAENVATLIRNLFTTFQTVYMADKDFVKHFPLKDKVEKGKVAGKIPDLAKLVRRVNDEDGETALVGRAAANSQIVYNWNGQDLPTSMLNVILHDYLSDFKSGYVVTWSLFKDAVEKAASKAGLDTKSYAAAAKHGLTVEFATGTLKLSVRK